MAERGGRPSGRTDEKERKGEPDCEPGQQEDGETGGEERRKRGFT